MESVLVDNNIMNVVSEKVLEVLSQSGLDIDDIDYQELVDRQVGVLERPKVNISINSGTFQKITMNTVNKLKPIMSLFIVVMDVSGEKERRFAAQKLIVGIANLLMNQKFNLPLNEPFVPINFANVTDVAYSGSGYALFRLDFSFSFQIDKAESVEDNQGQLLKIVNDYFLHTPNDDGELDLQSVVDFTVYNGGNAYSVYKLEPIFGGFSSSEYEDSPIYGGKALSTYN